MASAVWQVVDVDDWASDDVEEPDEPLGTKEKRWVVDSDGQRWLFKYAREVDGVVRGEDWAEWLVHHLAELLSAPSALVRPARCGTRRGIVSQSVVSPDQRLEHGNELLARVDPSYDVKAKRENPGYTVAAVAESMANVGPPHGYGELSSMTGFDVWAGYLMLDALVAGRDRHHANWAAIVETGDDRWLAPSFDHGNALGFQEPEDRINALVASPARVEVWCRRGKSHHFSGRPSLVSVADEALNAADACARDFWRARLRDLPWDGVSELLRQVPEPIMSEVRRSFCLRLLKTNQRRVLDGD